MGPHEKIVREADRADIWAGGYHYEMASVERSERRIRLFCWSVIGLALVFHVLRWLT